MYAETISNNINQLIRNHFLEHQYTGDEWNISVWENLRRPSISIEEWT